MSILAKHLEFVNEQIAFHDKMVEKVGATSFRGTLHKGTADKFRALSADLENADKFLDTPSPVVRPQTKGQSQIQLSLTIEDIEGLPEELVQELSLSDADKTEFEIVNSIEEAGGIISLDKLLIALYKRTGEVHKRNSLYSKLGRMASKNLIYYVPGKKGVYSTEQLSTEDVARMFGAVKQDEN
jgi:hypothetical protein